MLKEKNIGIYFEKEGINTLDGSGELLITILSSQAQEESRNISENTRWGVVRRFENGVVSINHNRFMGYTKNENNELVIVPEEAKIVRLIFKLYLEGLSAYKIAQNLSEQGLKTVTGKKWYDTVIFSMLKNEKYMGDVLQQKTYTVDFLSKTRVINKGIVPQYYIEDDHEAIIPKEIFYKVHEELARRSSLSKKNANKNKFDTIEEKGKYRSKYALTDMMVCRVCEHPYRRQTWSKYGEKSVVWRCESRLKNGTKHCKHSPTLKEKPLHSAIMEAINSVVDNKGEFVSAFRENVIWVIGDYSTKNTATEYDDPINRMQAEMLALIEENADQCIENGWSSTVLHHQIESGLYERQALVEKQMNFKEQLMNPLGEQAEEIMKDPYIFDFIPSAQKMKETELENALIQQITKLLLEFGSGFAFMGNQYPITVGSREFFIDLLFYNVKLHCYFVVELKTVEFEPEFAGKLSFYLSAIDGELRTEYDNPTIGLLLCKGKDRVVAEYALKDINKPMGISEYKLSNKISEELSKNLPTIEDIERRINT